MDLVKIKFYFNFVLKYNFYYKLKFFSLIIITFITYYFFILGISIEMDVSYYYEKNYYLSFATPFILTPENIAKNELNNFNISLKNQIFNKDIDSKLKLFKNKIISKGFSIFDVIVSRGTIFDNKGKGIPITIIFMDFNNIKFFEGIDISSINGYNTKNYNLKILKTKNSDCIVSEQLSKFLNQKHLIGTVTINGDYNMAKLFVRYFYKYKTNIIKNITYPVVIISKDFAKRFIGYNEGDNTLFFIYKKDGYKNYKYYKILKNLLILNNLNANLFSVENIDKDVYQTFKYINIFLIIVILIIAFVLTILSILINYFTLKDRYSTIGVLKSFGMKDINIFLLFLSEILILNLFAYFLSLLFYILTIKYIFNFHFTLGDIISNQLDIHYKLFLYLLPVLFIQSIISCYALYIKVKKANVIRIINGGI